MSDELHNNEPTEEPSVLDYVKSLFRFGGAERISLPKFVEQERPAPATSDKSTIAYLRSLSRFPWRSLLALLLAVQLVATGSASVTTLPVANVAAHTIRR